MITYVHAALENETKAVILHLEKIRDGELQRVEYNSVSNLNIIVYEEEIRVITDKSNYSISKLEKDDAIIIYIGDEIVEIITAENQRIKERKPRLKFGALRERTW